jgi:4'-phosphopantetheinyl transferase
MLTVHWQLRTRLDALDLPAPNTIHVWKMVARGSGFALSNAERDRAKRIQNTAAREAFIASRSGIRSIIAGYLQIDSRDVHWEKDVNGKPIVSSAPHLHFSLAHTDRLVLLAFAMEPVGIDCESMHRKPSIDAIAARYFAPAEAAFLAALSPAIRTDAFLRIWVAKEAALKLAGVGLSGGIDQALTPCSEAPIIRVQLHGRPASAIPFLADVETFASIAVWAPHPAALWYAFQPGGEG